ncbi:zinc ribbon domain-containing protein [uncultured Methanobrevibacter sp.]|uniref:zinc ribbon domain-containing protein n=1 Tax=uncultured Methanobrevibacter sp. TaxID=253161 RepID=UPI002613ECA7
MSLWNAYSSTLYGEGKISKVLEKKYGMKYYKASSAMKKDNIHGFKLFLLRNKGIKLKEVNENDIDGLVQEYWNHIDEIAQKTTGYEGFKNGVTYQAKFAGINTTTTGIANANNGWGGGFATSKSQVDFFTCKFHMEGDVFVYGEQGNRVMGSFSIKNIKSIRLDNKQLNIIDEYNNRIMIRHGIISTISLQTLQEYILKLREELLENDQSIARNPALESNRDAASEIEKFFNLKEKGIISEEEFELKKKELLGLSESVETSQNLLKDRENSIGAAQSLVNSEDSFDELSLDTEESFDEFSLDTGEGLYERAQNLVNEGDDFADSVQRSMDIEEKIICPNCNSELSSKVKFCTQCGYKLDLECPSCGNGIHEDDMFCTNCGFRLN